MIEIEVLARLACGDLEGEEELAAEEHVLGCTECAQVLEGLCVAGAEVGRMVARGGGMVQIPVSEGTIARLEADGLITRRYRISAGATVPCAIDSGDIFTLMVFELDLTGVGRVDVQIGPLRMIDVPFDVARRRISWIFPATRARLLPKAKIPVRALVVEPDGSERTLADAVLEHAYTE